MVVTQFDFSLAVYYLLSLITAQITKNVHLELYTITGFEQDGLCHSFFQFDHAQLQTVSTQYEAGIIYKSWSLQGAATENDGCQLHSECQTCDG